MKDATDISGMNPADAYELGRKDEKVVLTEELKEWVDNMEPTKEFGDDTHFCNGYDRAMFDLLEFLK